MELWIPFINSPPVVAVVRLQGVIGLGGRGGGLSDAGIGPVLERAFRRGKPKALALVINSPGGSPVQSSLIGARIRRLSEETKVPVYAFVEDVAASGGYWLASAADEIWVDESSIVGSIGVISAGFGLQNLIERLGVERRVHTAGRSKSMLDPFRPEKDEDVVRLKSLLDDIHQNFIRQVESRRGAKLAEDESLFTGEFWLGAKAIELGLADGIGHCTSRMKEVFGEKTRFRTYGQRRSLLQRFGLRLAKDAVALIEERTAFARFGL
jgi:signal peptide peptidase SppA